ncbi:MAG: methylenetetrahydrofolate reductase [NAD(P)H] [Paludibacteraceae bacterium]|nr:methylenetetrahydrofolate reductase [NAD(P)H] [Paludibacteraceae bacterium]
MSVKDLILNSKKTAFSFEILPPLKGNGIEAIYNTIDELREFDPKYIDITTHRSQLVYRTLENGLFQCDRVRQRPGTVAVAAAIKNKYNIDVVPHILCSGFSKEETEYVLIDLDFLGIYDLLLLRGDKAKHENTFMPSEEGYAHASELQLQINRFNEGFFLDGTKQKQPRTRCFTYGVAGYPEKHDEAPNVDSDIYWLKKKVENGADYIVTQMFFDNEKYFSFVDRCHKEGITVPIVPGLKPITTLKQLTVLPKTFHLDLPEDLAIELRKCKTDEEARAVGIEWCTMQSKELMEKGVPSIHFYSMSTAKSIKEIAKRVY